MKLDWQFRRRCAVALKTIVLAGTLVLPTKAVSLTGRDYAVELTAGVASDPPEIHLQWPGDQYARTYTINRKLRDEKEWVQIGTADGPATGFIDRGVQVGQAYEYQVIKDSSLGQTAYGYIYSGINVPLVEDRGRIILLTEEKLASLLGPEVNRLEYDLIGDGWSVARASVKETDSPNTVKSVITEVYKQDPTNTRALILYGHIPVAYSGNIMPDGHTNHMGAWPTDVYYADVDGAWTDNTVNSTIAELPRNWNTPGDGKFDQNQPPSAIELQTGRIDFWNLTCYLNKSPSRSEVDLARNYLNKDHRFRSGLFPVEQRAIIYDHIESKTAEPVMAMGWRNFAPFVGSNIKVIDYLEYFPTVSTGTYLWSAVTAGGGYFHSDGVGTSDAFALNDANVVFTTFLGSYYGDWNAESAFLRAAIGGNGTLLTTVYSGQPQWLFHHMALGENIGYSAKVTQENGTNGVYAPHNSGAGQVHVTLLGDPSLRAHPIPTVKNLRAQTNSGAFVLAWDGPAIDNLIGYHVYTSTDPKGPYHRLTVDPLPAPQLSLSEPAPGQFFMVKAIALTRSASGSYYNSSRGEFFPDPLASVNSTLPQAPTNLVIARITQSAITLSWVSGSANQTGFQLERQAPAETEFHVVATLGPDVLSYEDRAVASPGTYLYRVRAVNAAGASDPSNQVKATTLSAWAEFIRSDFVTQGDWMGRYGADGYILPAVEDKIPTFSTLSVSNIYLYQTAQTADRRAVLVPTSDKRSANCWVAGNPFDFQVTFTDDKVHQLSFYTLAWERQNTFLKFDVLDAVTGAVLDERTFSNINDGMYAVYNVRRQVYVRITPPNSFTNGEIYGVFYDPVKIAPVRMDPPGGDFTGKVRVSLSIETPGADIYYTTDGSTPTASSKRYDGTFWLTSDALVKAVGLRDGYTDSPIAEAQFQNKLLNVEGFIGWDDQTQGNWIGKYGAEGYWIANGGKFISGYGDADVSNATEWTWGDGAGDQRAPFFDLSGFARQATAWYGTDELDLNLSVFDTKLHQISLYFIDWDRIGRVEEVEVLDPQGAVKDRYTVQQFENGRYLRLAAQGQLRVRVRRVQGANVVLSGIFFDAAPGELFIPKPVPITDALVQNGLMTFKVTVFPAQQICTDRSSDLVNWECFSTNSASAGTSVLTVPISDQGPMKFFRTHFVP